jgi:CrcB protein
VRVLLLAGVCGGFTTFSSFAYDTLELMHSGQMALAMANVTAQIVLGVAAVSSGIALAHAAS